MSSNSTKPTVAVHKFSSCDGCQLAFINAGADLVQLSQLVDIHHFAEAGPVNEEAEVDIAFIEGSVAAEGDIERLKKIRANSKLLITIGACATTGGIQALRNMAETQNWVNAVYAKPEFITSLENSSAIKDHVTVDFELWGCPVTKRQVFTAVRSLLNGVTPLDESDKVCMECKRNHNVCLLVTKDTPCMGAVTRTGCGALCPHAGRDCYGCFGPSENPNSASLANRFEGFGLQKDETARRFLFINSAAEAFHHQGEALMSEAGKKS